MGTNETIRGNVADVYVVNDDISDTARITNAKFNASVGHNFAGILTGSATSGYVTLVTVTTAVTFYLGVVQVTAAGTSGGVSLVNSGAETLVDEIACSAAAAIYGSFATAVGTAKAIEVTAGGSLYALYTTGTATANFRAKYFVSCITTPS